MSVCFSQVCPRRVCGRLSKMGKVVDIEEASGKIEEETSTAGRTDGKDCTKSDKVEADGQTERKDCTKDNRTNVSSFVNFPQSFINPLFLSLFCVSRKKKITKQ